MVKSVLFCVAQIFFVLLCAMAFIYYDKAKLRSKVLAITIRLLLFLQAYSSILAGIFSFCFYIQTTEAKNLTKNYLTSENQNGIKNRTEMLQEAEAEAGKTHFYCKC